MMRAFVQVLLLICAVQALRVPFFDKNIQRNSSTVFTRYLEAPNNIRDVRCLLSQGDTLVPVIGLQKSRSLFVSKRRGLFASGVYPGVEYKRVNITVLSTSSSSPVTSSTPRKEVTTLQGLLGREFRNDGATCSLDVENNTINKGNDKNSNIIDDILINEEEEESVVELTVAPAYPLIPVLERDWPVRIALSGKKLVSQVMIDLFSLYISE